MAVFENNNFYKSDDIRFAASATSGIISLDGLIPIAIVTPASFTATSITFQHSTTQDGTFYDVYDDTGAKITITVSGSNASWTDITNVCPASCGGFIKLVASTSITNTVQLVSRNAQ